MLGLFAVDVGEDTGTPVSARPLGLRESRFMAVLPESGSGTGSAKLTPRRREGDEDTALAPSKQPVGDRAAATHRRLIGDPSL
jgi:hypothetical protein